MHQNWVAIYREGEFSFWVVPIYICSSIEWICTRSKFISLRHLWLVLKYRFLLKKNHPAFLSLYLKNKSPGNLSSFNAGYNWQTYQYSWYLYRIASVIPLSVLFFSAALAKNKELSVCRQRFSHHFKCLFFYPFCKDKWRRKEHNPASVMSSSCLTTMQQIVETFKVFCNVADNTECEMKSFRIFLIRGNNQVSRVTLLREEVARICLPPEAFAAYHTWEERSIASIKHAGMLTASST